MKTRIGIILLLVAALLLPVTAAAAPAEVSAKSAVLMDVATGQLLYEQNAHAPLAPASVT